MRIVGKEKILTSYEDRWIAGARASDLAKSLGVPSLRETGVFRGPQSIFDQMDEDRLKRKRRWLNEHAV